MGRDILPTTAVLAAVLSSSAAAEAPKIVTAPDWVRRPTPQELMHVWPAEALKAGLTGNAVIGCKVTVRGVLFDCVVVSESPPGAEFGAAALTLAPLLLMRPATADGAPIEADVRIPIVFQAPESFVKPSVAWTGSENLEGMRSIVTHPPWIEAPTLQDVVAAFPERARAGRTSGQVTLSCVIDDKLGLEPCKATVEEPRGMGFGKAARRLVTKFKAPDKGADGSSLRNTVVNVVVSFTPDMLAGKIPPSQQYWAEKPSAADLAANMPEAARKAGLKEARATLVCRVAPQGRLNDCSITEESPSGQGLGEAALALASRYRVSPWSLDGVPIVGVQVRVPVQFVPPPGAPPS